MKVACISDLHGDLPQIEECDLLIIVGDVCPHFSHKFTDSRDFEKLKQEEWLKNEFNTWLRNVPSLDIVGIAGNHDFGLLNEELADKLNWHYLLNESIEIQSVKLWGSPYSKKFFDWAFMAEDDKLKNLWEQIPENLDFLITHGPPMGILDMSEFQNENCGSLSLLNKVREVCPRYHVFGHIHEGRGIQCGSHTTFINCSHVRYKRRNGPIYLEI